MTESDELNPGMMAKKECLLPPGEAGGRSAQEYCAADCEEEHGFLRRTIVPVQGRGRFTLSCVCPHCHRYPLEDYIWWVST